MQRVLANKNKETVLFANQLQSWSATLATLVNGCCFSFLKAQSTTQTEDGMPVLLLFY